MVTLAVAAAGLIGCAGSEAGGRTASPGIGAEVGDDAPPEEAEVQRGGKLLYGLESDPNGLDPTRNAWDNAGIQLANALYDPLAAFSAEGKAEPYLAESFAPNAAYTSWLVVLRENVRFHDGSPLDSSALVEFINGLRESIITGPPAQLIKAVRAVDTRTVQIETSRPWAALPALLAGQGGYVISPKQLHSVDGTSRPIGTGPFMLRNWQIDQRFELVRNPSYWREGLPYLDAVDFVVANKGSDRLDLLSRGLLDATALTSPWDLRALDELQSRAAPERKLLVERDTGDAEKNSIMFNTTKAPLDDVRVRRAIAYATDLRAIATASDWPLDRMAVGPIDPASPYFSAAEYPSYNVEKAKALVREYLADTSIKPRRREVSFSMQAAEMNADLVNQLKAQWAQAGIKVTIELVDPKQVVRLAVFGDYESTILRYFSAVDPDVLWHFFVADTIPSSGISLNFARVRDADITSGFNEARGTADVTARQAAYAKAQRGFAASMPFIWLNRSEWRVASSRRVRNAHNVTLPDGSRAMPLIAGTFRMAETWLKH